MHCVASIPHIVVHVYTLNHDIKFVCLIHRKQLESYGNFIFFNAYITSQPTFRVALKVRVLENIWSVIFSSRSSKDRRYENLSLSQALVFVVSGRCCGVIFCRYEAMG